MLRTAYSARPPFERRREARAKIEARAKDRYERELAEHRAKLAAREAKEKTTGKKSGGKRHERRHGRRSAGSDWRHVYHSIVCIGALVAHRNESGWVVDALGAPHVGDRSEKQLIAAFVDRIAELSPQLVTFNGNSFDLPVLRYRAMINKVPVPGLSARPYFNRYSEDALDLCDALSSFSMQGKATLHEISKVLGLPGKPDCIDGGEVHRYFQDGKIQEIADYCETDIVNTIAYGCATSCFAAGLPQTSSKRASRGSQPFSKAKKRRSRI